MQYGHDQNPGMCNWMSYQVAPTPMSITDQDGNRLRLHSKFLSGDFLTNERLKLDQPNISPNYQLFHAPLESSEHVVVVFRATQGVQSRLMPDLMNTVAQWTSLVSSTNFHHDTFSPWLHLTQPLWLLPRTSLQPSHFHYLQRLDLCNKFCMVMFAENLKKWKWRF